MKNIKKRGLSPVITTILLILMAVVIAVMILLWAKEFQKESLRKFDQPIDDICREVNFGAELKSDTEISVVNFGTVPIYIFEVKIKGQSSEVLTSDEINLLQGNSAFFDLGETLSGYEEIEVTPVILGQSSDETASPYSCKSASKSI